MDGYFTLPAFKFKQIHHHLIQVYPITKKITIVAITIEKIIFSSNLLIKVMVIYPAHNLCEGFTLTR